MKFENYLSLKKALYIAMPCLALSFFVSCSNEEATGASEELPFSTNLTLTATVPVAKQSFSTRIGIDDDKISDNAGVEEPYVWIEGETLTLYWKNLHDSGNDKVIEYKVAGVSNEGKSCKMNPVGSPSLAPGFYKIHALSPHTAFNFVGNELKATIDLGNQNQPSGAVDHDYLSNKMYQYATTVVQIHGGNIVSGTTNLPFEFITSLFRVRVVNNTGLPIDVKKISLSFSSANNTQFYSKGIFTAADPVGDHSYAAAAGAITNDLSITTNKSLAVDGNFDAYMSFFPTDGYASGSTEILNVAVEYDVNGTPGTFSRTPSVTNSIFQTGSRFFKFEGGDRYLLTLTIGEGDLPTGITPPPIEPTYNILSHAGYLYSNNMIKENITIHATYGEGGYPLIAFRDLTVACPDDWHLVQSSFYPSEEDRLQMYLALFASFRGHVDPSSSYRLSGIALRSGPMRFDLINYDGTVTSVDTEDRPFLLRPICRKKIQ